jgi:hypothetical protein
VPAVTGVVGIAGGVLLGRTALQYKVRKALGNPLLGKIDFGGVTEQICEAEQQFGKLADEIRAAREKAEKIGRSLG